MDLIDDSIIAKANQDPWWLLYALGFYETIKVINISSSGHSQFRKKIRMISLTKI
jgi:hypothetical protein